MSDKIKTALCILLGLVTFAGAVWGANEYLHKYLEKAEFVAFKQVYDLDKIQLRMEYLERRMFEMSREFGANCQNASPPIQKVYSDHLIEYKKLQRQVRALMKGSK